MIFSKARFGKFIRDCRSGSLGVIILALVVAVSAVTSVGFFTDRVRLAMEQRAGELLAADVLVEASSPVAFGYAEKALQEGLAVSRQVEFPSVVLDAQGMPKLVSVKVVEEGYPFRGRLRVSDTPFATGVETDMIPEPGSLWASSSLFAEGGLRLDQHIELGAASFRLARVLSYEPDNTGLFFQIAAPRVLMNRADLESAGLLSEASRARYRLLVAGKPGPINTFIEWARGRDNPAVEIRSVREVQPEIRTALDRAASFLALASITAVVIAGAATLLAVRLYARQQQDLTAIMRCLGASQSYVVQNFLVQLLAAALLATALGCLVGVIAQEFLASLASNAIEIELPRPSLRPLFTGAVTGLLVAFGFGLSPILSLRRVPVLGLLRREIGPPSPSSSLATCFALVATAIIVLWQAQNLALAFWVIILLALLFVALAAVGAMLVYVARRFPTRHPGIRYALTSLGRRPGISTLQVVSFGAGIMALLLLTVIRVDLVKNWQSVIPENAPNQFVINIQPDQKSGVETLLADRDLRSPGVFPMVRARLDQERSDGEWQGWNSERQDGVDTMPRDFNLSFVETLPEHNEMIVGRWWSDDEARGEWSLEEGIAASLGVEVGDTLSFDVGGIRVDGEVVNIRRVNWDSFQVNFFVIGKSAMLRGYPATYITSFYLPKEQAGLTGILVRHFPGITVFDIGALIAQVRSIIQQVSIAVQYVFAFTLFAGMVVLYVAVQASASERMREVAILRSLGAGRRRLWSAQLAEFVLLGAMAGLVAAVFANVSGYILSKNIFELPFNPSLSLFVAGIAGGAVGVGLAGILAVRGVLRRPPLESLQRL